MRSSNIVDSTKTRDVFKREVMVSLKHFARTINPSVFRKGAEKVAKLSSEYFFGIVVIPASEKHNGFLF